MKRPVIVTAASGVGPAEADSFGGPQVSDTTKTENM